MGIFEELMEIWLNEVCDTFQGLFKAIKTVEIIEELVEIDSNEVCDIKTISR